MVEAASGVVAPHNAQGPVSTAACLQLAACCNNYLIQEFFDDGKVTEAMQPICRETVYDWINHQSPEWQALVRRDARLPKESDFLLVSHYPKE